MLRILSRSWKAFTTMQYWNVYEHTTLNSVNVFLTRRNAGLVALFFRCADCWNAVDPMVPIRVAFRTGTAAAWRVAARNCGPRPTRSQQHRIIPIHQDFQPSKKCANEICSWWYMNHWWSCVRVLNRDSTCFCFEIFDITTCLWEPCPRSKGGGGFFARLLSGPSYDEASELYVQVPDQCLAISKSNQINKIWRSLPIFFEICYLLAGSYSTRPVLRDWAYYC